MRFRVWGLGFGFRVSGLGVRFGVSGVGPPPTCPPLRLRRLRPRPPPTPTRPPPLRRFLPPPRPTRLRSRSPPPPPLPPPLLPPASLLRSEASSRFRRGVWRREATPLFLVAPRLGGREAPRLGGRGVGGSTAAGVGGSSSGCWRKRLTIKLTNRRREQHVRELLEVDGPGTCDRERERERECVCV